jgi:tetratricopeptide (TPR) repeat protein
MSEFTPISEELQAELDQVAAEGNALAEQGKYSEAASVFRSGFDMITPPREGRSTSLLFIVAIGDMQWLGKDYQASLETWRDAILLYGGFGNPFVHLRRGQALFELGNKAEASNELLRALLLGGEDVFAREELDYWVFITSQADAPEGYPDWIGWPGFPEDSPEFQQSTDPSGVYQFTRKTSH